MYAARVSSGCRATASTFIISRDPAGRLREPRLEHFGQRDSGAGRAVVLDRVADQLLEKERAAGRFTDDRRDAGFRRSAGKQRQHEPARLVVRSADRR